MGSQASARGAGGQAGPAGRPDRAGRSPVTLIVGEEELLVERAVAGLLAAAASGGQHAPVVAGGADVHDVTGAELAPGELTTLTSPSLFGGECVVIVRAAQDASAAVATEIGQLAAAMPPEVSLVVTHAGGAKGKALLTSLAAAGARRIDCPAVRRFGERMDFLRAEFAAAGRKADDSGLRALIDAVGTDLRDLAAACDQLAADTTGVISGQVVARYWRGRAEASGFSVADRAVEGRLADALEMLRWALAVGVSPVLITSGLAQGVRLLGRVGGAPRGQAAAALAAEVGAPPWKIDRVRQQLRGWTPEGIAHAMAAIAEADAQVKGEGTSPGYALEAAIRTIVACRAG